MKKLDIVNWGIIGVGDVTEVKSGPALYKIEHSNVVAVMRRNSKKAANYARRHGIGKWYSDAIELIGDSEVNAVYVATPPNTHATYAIAAMRAGKPVYVEKPMARTHAECQEMLDVSSETGMPLWVAYYRRALPAFVKAKELIETGEIGKPSMVRVTLCKPAAERNLEQVQMNWRVFPEIGGAGHFYDLASHQFDYLDFALGRITKVNGVASNLGGLYPAEDTVEASWEHETGITGEGDWSFIAPDGCDRDEIVIIGDKGKLVLSSFAHPELLKITAHSGKTKLEFPNPRHISQPLIQQVVDELQGKGNCVSTGESAARTNMILEEVIRDYYAGKT